MHEMAIAQGILEIALDAAAKHDAKIIKNIKLLVGQMTGVEPDALHFCFSAVADGTIAAEAELAIELVPLVGKCGDCRCKFNIEGYRFICDNCRSTKVEIISGRELRVEHLEVD